MAYRAAPDGIRIVAKPLVEASLQLRNPNAKVIHLIRHGEAIHNRLYKQLSVQCSCPNECLFTNTELVDPRLTERGHESARNASTRLRCLPLPQLCITSPMMRTAETAMIALHGMDIPCIAQEGCRERIGVHAHNKRHAVEELARAFPKIDFKSLENGTDPYFSHDTRESFEEIAERGRGFFWELRNYPQRVLVIVSHKTFLFHAFNNAIDSDEFLRRGFSTGEVRSAVLTWHTNAVD